jgi:hypothetical protein
MKATKPYLTPEMVHAQREHKPPVPTALRIRPKAARDLRPGISETGALQRMRARRHGG